MVACDKLSLYVFSVTMRISMSEQIYTVRSVEELSNVATKLLQHGHTKAEGATVWALHGDLGAGKTTFVQQVAQHLGVTEVVTSPTFVVMKLYEVPERAESTEKDHDLDEGSREGTAESCSCLIHIDAYRLDDPSELAVLGFADLLADPTNLICIEWAEKVTELLPETTTNIMFTIGEEEVRTIQIDI